MNIKILDEIRNFDIMDVKLQNKKIELIQWFSTLNDKSLIEKLIKFREEERTDWWTEISDLEKKSIEKGIQDANNGKLTPHSTAKKAYENWL